MTIEKMTRGIPDPRKLLNWRVRINKILLGDKSKVSRGNLLYPAGLEMGLLCAQDEALATPVA